MKTFKDYVRPEFGLYEGVQVPLEMPMVDLSEESDGEDKPLNKPKRGGPKKFYVFVKDPSTGNIKKVTFGDSGGAADGSTLSSKINDKEARNAYAARHKCSTQKDKTSAAYWSCNLPRYASQLGLKGGGSFYW